MNQLYDYARVKFLNALINWPTIDLVVSAWGGTAVFDATQTTIGDIVTAGYTELGTSLPIEGTSVGGTGTAQSDPVLIPDIAVGETITWFTLSEKKPTHSLSQLILFIDTTVEELPFEGTGLDVILQPDWLTFRSWFRP